MPRRRLRIPAVRLGDGNRGVIRIISPAAIGVSAADPCPSSQASVGSVSRKSRGARTRLRPGESKSMRISQCAPLVLADRVSSAAGAYKARRLAQGQQRLGASAPDKVALALVQADRLTGRLTRLAV